MKIFVSYRFTGESLKNLNTLLGTVKTGLENNGVDSFCSFFYEDHYRLNKFDSRQIMDHALGELDNAQALLGIITTEEKSAGMLMEVGYALARNVPIILAFQADVPRMYLRDMADASFTWTDLHDLEHKLANYDFATSSSRRATNASG